MSTETNAISIFTMNSSHALLPGLASAPAALILITLLIMAVRAAAPAAEPARPVAPNATRFLPLAGGTIAYDDTGGAGPLVVCVPGLGDLRTQYRFLAPMLQRAGYRVVTMDLRGLGESSVPWPDYSPAAVGADIVALIRHLGAPPAIVIGNSMAAAAAVWAAAEMPDRITHIVLIGPFVRDIPPSWPTAMLLKAALLRPWAIAFWSRYYASLYPTSPPADLDDYRARLRDNLAQPGRLDALKAMIWASKDPCEARIPEVRARVMVVMGSRDPDFTDPAAEAKLVADRLHAETLMVKDAGHYPHAEMPDRVAEPITRFLAGVAPRNIAGTRDAGQSGT